MASGSLFEDGTIGGELASDIQHQAEQIRRERMSKRAKAQQEAEKAKAQQEVERALTRTTSLLRGSSGRGDDGPLVGNLIGEGHVNYVLMYNMLTGIRIAVSRCQAKIRRPLTAEDYTARHKFSFDIVGNELTPSAKYDFKFKDYAPWVFRELREDYFHLDPADYLLSLTAKYILSELGSPGKSGSFFYFSRDYRFIIKTIRHSEHKFLLSILPQYYSHVKNNPHTLLSRFYGLHRVKLPHGRKIHFVIMNNLFPAHKDIHETYDLKGSTEGREYPEDKAAQNPRAVLKDLNWIHRGKKLELGPEKRALLTEQIRRDSELLKQLRVMDYSLLVGIHNMQRGNRDNVRSNTLKIFSPDMPTVRRKMTQGKGPSSPEAIAMRRIMRESDPKRLGSGTFKLPEEDTGERQYFLFYQDEGGLRATDEANENLDTIYYLGIIDILTPYSCVKKLEHFWKGLQADRHKISPVPPGEYSERFFNFMKSIIHGGDHGEKVEGNGKSKAE
ncbi:SAICAR synthase-like protein [Obba rivulosa]|uniref:1-phosphatidylinositol-4-phosphate 5-kinase n=1 Tax=Obba rivulosa TaxID=1052685 RepID=A0A8E2DK69_9APHY|nr:SAICAR synthase-like protein [Obba rivulosa]